jgi:hypothetical protein
MKLVDLMNGCLDAGDVPGAAFCVLAHPMSQKLENRSVDRLLAIATGISDATECDLMMIEIACDLICVREKLH